MGMFRIALANPRFPSRPEESVALAEEAIADAVFKGAGLICFPECYVPGYRGVGTKVPAADATFLDGAWQAIAAKAKKSKIAVILGTERLSDQGLVPTVLVVNPNGTMPDFKTKFSSIHRKSPLTKAVRTDKSSRPVS
jgi:predicted amidohydrolase